MPRPAARAALGPSPASGWVVLAAGLVSAAALLAAAALTLGDEDAAGRASLARLAGEVTASVREEALRVLADPLPRGDGPTRWANTPDGAAPDAESLVDPGAAAQGRLAASMKGVAMSFDPREPLPRSPSPVEPADEPSPVFDALLAEARAARRRGDLDAAADLAREAAGKPVDPARRGTALLLLMQLGAARNDAALVRDAWSLARETLRGDEALGGTSLLLLCGLAAGDALPEGGIAFLQERWTAGALALPGPAPATISDDPADSPAVGAGAGAAVVESPTRRLLRERLAGPRAPGSDQARTRWLVASEAFAAAELLDRSGVGWPPRSAEEGLPLLPVPGGWFWWQPVVGTAGVTGTAGTAGRAGTTGAAGTAGAPGAAGMAGMVGAAGSLEIAFLTDADLRERLAAAVSAARLLPEGFALDWRGDRDDLGEALRDPVPLLGDRLAFTLRHADPAGFVADAGSRTRWVRAGLLLAALFAAGASVATFRALRRERRLARLKSAFVAGVSHELRTPVASIQLLAENIESGRVQGEAALLRYVGLIRREARRLGRLVNDVLDFSRIERGEPARLSLDTVDLEAWAEELADDALALAGRLGAELSVRCGALPLEAELDADALRRAVLNLVDNAARHGVRGRAADDASRERRAARAPGDGSGDGDDSDGRPLSSGDAATAPRPVAITLGIDTDGDALLVQVVDDGPGVARGERERVMQPFVTGGAGSGLGLSLVSAIATGHGGTLTLAAGPGGRGLCATLRVPLRAGTPSSTSGGDPS